MGLTSLVWWALVWLGVRHTLSPPGSFPSCSSPPPTTIKPRPTLRQSLSGSLSPTTSHPPTTNAERLSPFPSSRFFQFFLHRHFPSLPAMQSSSSSPLDLMSAIIKGKLDPSNVSSDSANEMASLIFENREIVMILTTSIAVLIGCVVVLIWRRSNGSKPKVVEPLRPLIVKEPELEVDDGTKKVTIFFGTQTGTAEGFAKVRLYMHTYLYFYVIHTRACMCEALSLWLLCLD